MENTETQRHRDVGIRNHKTHNPDSLCVLCLLWFLIPTSLCLCVSVFSSDHLPSTENAKSTFPGIPFDPYPDVIYSIPPATTAPMLLIEPPRAFTPLTVVKSCTVSKSQMILPPVVS